MTPTAPMGLAATWDPGDPPTQQPEGFFQIMTGLVPESLVRASLHRDHPPSLVVYSVASSSSTEHRAGSWRLLLYGSRE